MYETIERGVKVTQLPVEQVPAHVRGTPWEPFARVQVDVHLDIPRGDDLFTPIDLGFGGDAASAADAHNVSGPTCKFFACDRCMVKKSEQSSTAKAKSAVRRNYANTCARPN